jgi:hypothetical protein
MRVRSLAHCAVAVFLFGLLGMITIACGGNPIPMTAVRGSTVLIPIGGGGIVDGTKMGYGTPALPDGAPARRDWQRGRLRIWLDSEPSDSVPPEGELLVRSITRVRPDRASPAGLSEGEDYWLGDQVALVVDIPATAPLGWFYLIVERVIPQWDGTDWDQEVTATSAPAYRGLLEIVDGAGSPTPWDAWADIWSGNVSASIPGFVPYPKFRFVVQSSTTPIGSARFTITYPTSRMLIHGIVAEPISVDRIDWGPSALISYSEPTPGVLEVSCVAPEGVVQPAFAIVFELTNPSAPPASGGGPVTKANFTFSNVEAWDVSGAPLSPTVPGLEKKIY